MPCTSYAVSVFQISFVRQRDFRLLSNGHSLFTTDGRFEIVHRAKTVDWILRLRRAQLADSGRYMCQVRELSAKSRLVIGSRLRDSRLLLERQVLRALSAALCEPTVRNMEIISGLNIPINQLRHEPIIPAQKGVGRIGAA